jgi:hypothetical protein
LAISFVGLSRARRTVSCPSLIAVVVLVIALDHGRVVELARH